jgi:hypothetical protein
MVRCSFLPEVLISVRKGFFVDHKPLKLKVTHSFEIPATTYSVMHSMTSHRTGLLDYTAAKTSKLFKGFSPEI